MEGKLIKRNEHYFFWSSDWNPDKKEGFVANTTNLLPTKLSLKNCQEIENGYDLDELADYHFGIVGSEGISSTHSFKVGFQKALEILGDKKFSEEDVATAYDKGQILNIKGGQQSGKKYVKSLQPNEWDVEIEMEQYVKYVPKSLITIFPTGGVRPKLDADKCIILKRK